MTVETKWPEHERLEALRGENQSIGSFLDWLFNERGCEIARWEGNDLRPTNDRIEPLLAEYFNIDLDKLEEEKVAMLDELRKTNE